MSPLWCPTLLPLALGIEVVLEDTVMDVMEMDRHEARAASLELLQAYHNSMHRKNLVSRHVSIQGRDKLQDAIISACAMPIVSWFNDTLSNTISGDIEILDVGGGFSDMDSFVEESTHTEFQWSCMAKIASEKCEEYDGDHLNLPANSKDVVLFVETLHRRNALNILEDAANVARRYVVVNEFVHADDYTEAQNLFVHDSLGLYRPEYD